MRVVSEIAELRSVLDRERSAGRSVGFVPTMGYLHAGHQSLLSAAVQNNDVAFASIFVNPLQFAADEDLEDYPRDLDRDLELVGEVGVELVFVPSVDEMYPRPVVTEVALPELAADYEGASRPTHFTGVATVVTKLFAIAGPCRAYFGEKDFQQLAIIRRMVLDLSLPVEVVGCPIIREADGLAMSSRNVYLTPTERDAASVLYRSLTEVSRCGETDPEALADRLGELVRAEPLAELDYAAVVDPATFAPPEHVEPGHRLLVTARFGRPRLLDNMAVVGADER